VNSYGSLPSCRLRSELYVIRSFHNPLYNVLLHIDRCAYTELDARLWGP